MDFAPTDAQKDIAGLAKKIFGDKVTPAGLKALEAGARVSAELWKELATAGLLGVALPESVGGSGNGFLELCALLEEAGAAVAPVPLWATLVGAALPIAEFGSAEQKQRWLPGVAAGDVMLSAAFHEPGGGDAEAPQTRAERAGSDGGWVLTGVKTAVPVAALAQRVLLAAQTDAGIGLFLLDPRAPGVTLESQVSTSGEPAGRLTLARAQVAAVDVLVAPGPAAAAAWAWTIQRATVALCAMELGVAARALRMTAEYTAQRKQFDRPIATFQAVAQRAADAYIDVESIRVTCWQAAWLLSEGRDADARAAVAVAKLTAAEAGHRVVYAAQHLHGGIGFDTDYPLHRYYTLSKQLELTLGSASQHLVRLGAELARS